MQTPGGGSLKDDVGEMFSTCNRNLHSSWSKDFSEMLLFIFVLSSFGTLTTDCLLIIFFVPKSPRNGPPNPDESKRKHFGHVAPPPLMYPSQFLLVSTVILHISN